VPVEPLTPNAVLELVEALSRLGVQRFQWGDLAFDFGSSLAAEQGEAARDTLPPIPDNAVANAALRLANRGRPAA
jgi:hypothetical protein